MEHLTFTKQGISYICQITDNQQGGVVQITQKERGIVSVSANIPGLPPTVVGIYDNPYGNSVLIHLDIPDGLDVTIKSATEVTEAVWMQ